jgi:hypothetical protein
MHVGFLWRRDFDKRQMRTTGKGWITCLAERIQPSIPETQRVHQRNYDELGMLTKIGEG